MIEEQIIKRKLCRPIVFDYGDIVYVKTDTEQRQRMITSIQFPPYGDVLYQAALGSLSDWYYDFELSFDKDYTKT